MELWFTPEDSLLVIVPRGDGLHSFLGQRGKQEVGIFRLPGESLGFIERQSKQAFVYVERFAELGLDGSADAGEQLLTSGGAAIGKLIYFGLS